MRTHPLILVLLALASLVVLPAAVSADDLVVDNNTPFVQVSGPWVSTSLTEGFAGPDYLFRPASAGDATVFWPFPSSISPGRYEVFARWTSGPNRATNALYYVSSDAGTVSVTENQQSNGGVWQALGDFDFRPGKNHGVTLTDRWNGVVVADAIRWVGPIGQAAVPTQNSDLTAKWTVTLEPTDLHAGPESKTDILARLPQFSYLLSGPASRSVGSRVTVHVAV